MKIHDQELLDAVKNIEATQVRIHERINELRRSINGLKAKRGIGYYLYPAALVGMLFAGVHVDHLTILDNQVQVLESMQKFAESSISWVA